MFATHYNLDFEKRFAWYDRFCRTWGRILKNRAAIVDGTSKFAVTAEEDEVIRAVFQERKQFGYGIVIHRNIEIEIEHKLEVSIRNRTTFELRQIDAECGKLRHQMIQRTGPMLDCHDETDPSRSRINL